LLRGKGIYFVGCPFPAMREDVALLRERALRAFELAKKAFEDENYDWAVFLLEQACQLLLNHLLASKIGYFSRTHSLDRLLDEAAEVFREVSGFRERFRDKLGVLEDAYIASRYLARRYMKGGVEGLFVVFEELWRLVCSYEAC
ncbi:MAG: HEPN domain-containing protein, partial [Candidatus Freyarchaeota archaeon]|nr:HEPN domain-containing protein [Candidatus Jordarchaeia archaeon]